MMSKHHQTFDAHISILRILNMNLFPDFLYKYPEMLRSVGILRYLRALRRRRPKNIV